MTAGGVARVVGAAFLVLVCLLGGLGISGLAGHYACEHAGLSVADGQCLVRVLPPPAVAAAVGLAIGALLVGRGRRARFALIGGAAAFVLLALHLFGLSRVWPVREPDAIADGFAPGAVVLADDFGRPEAPRLDPAALGPGYTLAYVEGEYLLRTTTSPTAGAPFIAVPGRYRDSTVAVDARLVGPVERRAIVIGCRRALDGGPNGYRLAISPELGRFTLTQWDEGRPHELVPWQDAAAIRLDNDANRLALTCRGDSLAVTINGTVVASLPGRGTVFRGGLTSLGVGVLGGGSGESEARFDNLVLTQE